MTLAEIIASIIAALAFIVAIWNGLSSRKHNKNSVQPHLFFETVSPNNESAGLVLRNAGRGPAIIDKFVLGIDELWEDKINEKAWKKVIDFIESSGKIVMKKNKIKITPYSNICHFEPNQAIEPSEKVFIIELTEEDKIDRSMDFLSEVIQRLWIKIEYHSLYNDKYAIERSGGHGLISWIKHPG